MVESIRVGYTGSLEVHLKNKLQITREMVNQIATLPSTDKFYVVTRNTSTDNWVFEQGFNDFVDADNRFITLCGNNGLPKASKLTAGKHTDGRGHEMRA